ncbi:MAG: hypothetical protein E6J90_11755 [Deltaproteobacteria bacterium]|nr:MAG: hypothetical protein E6J91_45245 [Deltaproteobacteria bacterium]TMQ22842.1 MAG: hypothetical protein E6J90_11755 [Deltaproteobacteria bacterium]
MNRRTFLKTGLAGAGAAALAPLIKVRTGSAATTGKRVVIVGIGGGLRLRESLGMAEGATMPNLLGTAPLISGFGTSAGAPKIAPEYAARMPALVLPAPRATPLYAQGTLITNLRYADGPPGHLQGHGCLLSGYYNKLENRADAHLPVPTVFELHRKAANAPATDAWYVSAIGGFYRALISSDHADYGPRFAGVYLQPPGVMQPLAPIIVSGKHTLNVTAPVVLPTIPSDPAEDQAAARLTAVLDGNTPPFTSDATVHLAADDNARIQAHLAEIYADPTYDKFFAQSFGIGLHKDPSGIDATGDTRTIYHAERVLARFRPSVMAITLLDVDTCHADFNGYLRNQQLADAAVAHLWDFIQADPELRATTTMLVLPEHGRHLVMNGNNPDSLGRSGIDHGLGDDGDRNVWMLALGPDIRPGNVVAPTGISQTGRGSGRYETIDVIMTAMHLLGHDAAMTSELTDFGARPGLVIPEVMR